MNSICCCQCGDDFEEFPTNTLYRHCLCLRFFFHELFTRYGVLFHRIEGLPVSSPIQGTTSSSGVGSSLPNYLNEENPSRPLPYDAENRFKRLQRVLVFRWEKSMTRFQEDSQFVVEFAKRKSGTDLSTDQDSKSGSVESLEKSLKVKASEGLLYEQTSDNEDVCPTCLDEFTLENSKIVTQCSHHFHLRCIYKWMKRSDMCPICGKVMEFCESP